MRALKWAAGIALGTDEPAGYQNRGHGGRSSWDASSIDGSSSGRARSGSKGGTSRTARPRAETGWMDDEDSPSCLLCDALFTFTNRRHHCRCCLKLVCSACSSNMWKLESGRSLGKNSAGRRAAFKRVCDKCYAALVATKEVLVGGEPATLDSDEHTHTHAHFEVIVHETLGGGHTPRDTVPPSVPVGPSSPRLETAPAPGFGGGTSGSASTTPPSTPSAEAAPRLLGSEALNRARAPYCRLSVASKQVGKTRPIPQPQPLPPSLSAGVLSPINAGDNGGVGVGMAGVSRSSSVSSQGYHCFEQNFLFRVSCACRTADYVVLEVYDRAGGLSAAAGVDPLLGHCRVPLYRVSPKSEQTFWHLLLEADGAPGAVGRALVTVRNLGGGTLPRPAWGCSLPGGSLVLAPPGFTPRGPGKGEGGAWQQTPDRERPRTGGGEDKEVVEGLGLHEALFYRVDGGGGGGRDGRGKEKTLPFNERVLEVFAHVRMRPNADDNTDPKRGSISGGGGAPTGYPGGSGVSYSGAAGGGYSYYPRAMASLDPWGVGEGLRGALSSAGAALPSAGVAATAAATAAKNVAVAAVAAAGRGAAGGVGREGVGAGVYEAGVAPSSMDEVIAAATEYQACGNRVPSNGAVGPGTGGAGDALSPTAADGDGGGGDGDRGHDRDRDDSRHGYDNLRRRRSRSAALASSSSFVLDGALALTTHRVVFVERRRRHRPRRNREAEEEEAAAATEIGRGEEDGSDAGTLVEIPLAFIVETKVKRRPTEGLVGVQVECRDMKTYYFTVARGANRAADAALLQGIRRFEDEIAWLIEEDNFAHSSDTNRVDAALDSRGDSLGLDPDANPFLDNFDPTCISSDCTRGFPSGYHPAREHRRQGVDDSNEWAYSGVNKSFRLCPTYGRHLVVPSALDEGSIIRASKWRSRCRIPALTWLHPLTGAGLVRSSQPMTGLGINSSSPEDEQLLTAIRAAADLCLAGADCPAASRAGAGVRGGGDQYQQGKQSPVEEGSGMVMEGGQAAAAAGGGSRVGGSRLVVSPADSSPVRGGEETGADVPVGKVLFPRDIFADNGGGGGSSREPERRPRDTFQRDDSPIAVFLGDDGGSGAAARHALENDSNSNTNTNTNSSRSSPVSGLDANEASSRHISRLFPPVAPLDSVAAGKGAAGKGAAAGLSFSSSPNMAAELKDAIISPVTDMVGSGISRRGSGDSGAMYGSGISASGSDGLGFKSSAFSPIQPKSGFRAADGDSQTEAGAERDATAATQRVARRPPPQPNVRSWVEESSFQHPMSTSLAASGAAGVTVGASGSFSDSGGGGGGGDGGAEEAMDVNGDRVHGPHIGSSSGGGFLIGGDERNAEVDDGGSRVIEWDIPTPRGRAAAGGIDIDNHEEDDDNDDTHSLASSSVISVSSAPGNTCSRRSSLAGSAGAVPAECPPRAFSEPLSPQGGHHPVPGRRPSRRLSGFGAAAEASGTPNSLQMQRALSVPTSLAAIASPSTAAAAVRAAGGSGVLDGRAERTPAGEAAVAGTRAAASPERRSAVLRVIDARPMISAKGHLLIGKGHEVISRLGGPRQASLTFLEIPSVRVMQQSFADLMEACAAQEDDPAWLINLHNSRWLDYVGALLQGASDIVVHLEAGDPVLVHCSDGWDRTSQLTALAQLLVDPYYRTIEGFEVLVSKDWCAFGHRFAARGGHGREGTSETSPIFPQFLDATHQLLRQFPTSFEFSENLLLLLLHAYHSRWFNDFLHDSEYERVLAYARSQPCIITGNGNKTASDSTVSVWSQVRSSREIYTNVLWAGEPGSRQQSRAAGAGRPERCRAECDRGERGGVMQSGGSSGGGGGDVNNDECGGGGGGVNGGNSCSDRQARADRERASSLRRKRELLPPPLWPACGVRSLTVWQRAWASRGLQHPAHSGFRGDSSILEETMSSVIRRQRATIEALRLQVAGGGGGQQ